MFHNFNVEHVCVLQGAFGNKWLNEMTEAVRDNKHRTGRLTSPTLPADFSCKLV